MQNIIFIWTLAVFLLSFVRPVSFRRISLIVLSFLSAIKVLSPVYLVGDFFLLTSSFPLFYTWHPLIVRLFINNLVFYKKVFLLSSTTTRRRSPFTKCFINRSRCGISVNYFRGFFFAPTRSVAVLRPVLQKKKIVYVVRHYYRRRAAYSCGPNH